MSDMDPKCQCCGVCFDLKTFPVDINEIEDTLKFECVRGTTILIAAYVKDGSLWITFSFDCGKSWKDPVKASSFDGKPKSIQILSDGKLYVIAAIESTSNGKRRKAISGEITPDKHEFTYRECKIVESKRKFVDVSLGFQKKKDGTLETVDVVYEIDDDEICISCYGHG